MSQSLTVAIAIVIAVLLGCRRTHRFRVLRRLSASACVAIVVAGRWRCCRRWYAVCRATLCRCCVFVARGSVAFVGSVRKFCNVRTLLSCSPVDCTQRHNTLTRFLESGTGITLRDNCGSTCFMAVANWHQQFLVPEGA